MTEPPKVPNLSYSKAKTIILKSALHVKGEMDGTIEKARSETMLRGIIMEQLVTGYARPEDEVVGLDFKDFRKDEAKAARDKLLVEKKIPIIQSKLDELGPAAEAIRAQFVSLNIPKSMEYQKEVLWTDEHGNKCKGYIDAIAFYENGSIDIYDFKCVESANPGFCAKQVGDMGYDIQEAAYTQAIETLHPESAGRIKFYFIFFEWKPPYIVTKAQTNGEFKKMGKSKWKRAGSIWKKALTTDYWPAYTEQETVILEPKPWMLMQEEDAEAASE